MHQDKYLYSLKRIRRKTSINENDNGDDKNTQGLLNSACKKTTEENTEKNLDNSMGKLSKILKQKYKKNDYNNSIKIFIFIL